MHPLLIDPYCEVTRLRAGCRWHTCNHLLTPCVVLAIEQTTNPFSSVLSVLIDWGLFQQYLEMLPGTEPRTFYMPTASYVAPPISLLQSKYRLLPHRITACECRFSLTTHSPAFYKGATLVQKMPKQCMIVGQCIGKHALHIFVYKSMHRIRTIYLVLQLSYKLEQGTSN